MDTNALTEQMLTQSHKEKVVRAEDMTAAELRLHLKTLEPGKEFRVADCVYVYKQANGESKPFVRLSYLGKKHEFWQPTDLTAAKELYARCKREITECLANGVRWDPEQYKNKTLVAQQYQEGMTVEAWGAFWLDSIVKIKRAPGTYDTYRANLTHHVYPFMGDRPLKSLTQVDCFALARDILKKPAPRNGGTLSVGTVYTVLRMLVECFGEAISHNLMTTNPVPTPIKRRVIGELRLIYTKPKFKGYTEEEEATLLDGFLRYDPDWFPIHFVAFRTGLRKGELIALEPQDLDLVNCLISVRQTWNFNALQPTKGKRSRTVRISRETARILHVYLDRRHTEEQIRGVTFRFVFGWDADTPLPPNTLYGTFQSMVKFLGLRRVRFHDTRTTSATRLYEKTKDLRLVQEHLGHASVSTTAGYLSALEHPDSIMDLLDNGRYAPAISISASTPSPTPHSTPTTIALVPPDLPTVTPGFDLLVEAQKFEEHLIRQALQRTGGDRTAAASLLGINRTTLYNKLARMEEDNGAIPRQ
ncbi:MAG: hypothetical protein AMXMBFR67_37430 [Nitrospira sp.]